MSSTLLTNLQVRELSNSHLDDTSLDLTINQADAMILDYMGTAHPTEGTEFDLRRMVLVQLVRMLSYPDIAAFQNEAGILAALSPNPMPPNEIVQ